nr:SGNH/GDSL hydrolase family protein [Nocardioides perillae]
MGRPGRRWFVLGDSMSQGVGASRHDRGWVGQLARRLAADGLELQVLNLSATGARADDVVAQQLPLVERIGVREGDLTTVLVGSNDLYGGRAARRRLPAAYAALVAGVPPGTVVATLPRAHGVASRANAHVEEAAAVGRVRLLDLRTLGPDSWRGLLASDLFHPNDAGYAAIADAFEPTVRRALA